MNKPLTLTIDPIQQYLAKQPGYFSAGLRKNVDELESVFLAHADQIEYSLKRCLSGERTQEELFDQIQAFLRLDEEVATFMIGFSIKSIFDTLTLLEAYELLAPYQHLCQFIDHTFSIKPLNNNNDQ